MAKKKKDSITESIGNMISMEEKVSEDDLSTVISDFYRSNLDAWSTKIAKGKVVDIVPAIVEHVHANGFPEATEEEIKELLSDVVKRNKVETDIPEGWGKIIAKFDEYVYEDEDFVAVTCDTAGKIIYDLFRFNVNDPSDPLQNGYKMVAMVFICTYEEIIELLKRKREKHPTYMINIANRLEVGYTNSDDDDDEKVGNIMIYLRNIEHVTAPSDDYEAKMTGTTREFITQWNQENMIYNPDDTAAIASGAAKRLKTIDIELGSTEYIFPIFVTLYDCIISNIKIERRERNLDMLKINWCNCFTIKALEQDDGTDKITLIPSIEGKTDLKSDKYATSIYE